MTASAQVTEVAAAERGSTPGSWTLEALPHCRARCWAGALQAQDETLP